MIGQRFAPGNQSPASRAILATVSPNINPIRSRLLGDFFWWEVGHREKKNVEGGQVYAQMIVVILQQRNEFFSIQTHAFSSGVLPNHLVKRLSTSI